MVVNDILFKRVAHLVNKVNMHIGIIRIYLASTHIHRHKYRLNAAGGLRHQAGSACGGNGETSNVASAILHHVIIQLMVGLFYA